MNVIHEPVAALSDIIGQKLQAFDNDGIVLIQGQARRADIEDILRERTKDFKDPVNARRYCEAHKFASLAEDVSLEIVRTVGPILTETPEDVFIEAIFVEVHDGMLEILLRLSD